MKTILRTATVLFLLAGVVRSAEPAPFDRFEAAAVGHSWIDAYLLAQASHAAYRGRVKDLEGDTWAEKLRQPYAALGLELVAFVEGDDEKTDTQALLLENDAIVLVVFTGSEAHDTKAAYKDWKTDLKMKPLEVEDGLVHYGFQQALEAVWEKLEAALDDTLDDRSLLSPSGDQGGKKLWLTGHSAGGALANLAAFRLVGRSVDVQGVYTYAAPKIGDTAFVAELEQRLGARSQQWSTELDPITRLPETTNGETYAKLGVTNMVDASGDAKLDTTLKMRGIPNPMAHPMGAYLNYLYRALPEDTRAQVQLPPPRCPAATKMLGQHPEKGYPICLPPRFLKISAADCEADGGEVSESVCLKEVARKFRFSARKLKPARDG